MSPPIINSGCSYPPHPLLAQGKSDAGQNSSIPQYYPTVMYTVHTNMPFNTYILRTCTHWSCSRFLDHLEMFFLDRTFRAVGYLFHDLSGDLLSEGYMQLHTRGNQTCQSGNVIHTHTHSCCMNTLSDVSWVCMVSWKRQEQGLSCMTHHIWPSRECMNTRLGAQCACNRLATASIMCIHSGLACMTHHIWPSRECMNTHLGAQCACNRSATASIMCIHSGRALTYFLNTSNSAAE